MTQHISDIESAVERGSIADIEDAFGALIGWPNTDSIEGANGSKRAEILPFVCEALKHNYRIMPGDIMTMLEDADCGLSGGLYSDGARAVMSNLAYWGNHVRREA